MKLRVTHKWNSNYSKTPLIGSTVNTAALDMTKVTDYIGNKVYEQGVLKKILIDGGYIEDGKYYFYQQDHLGNNRMVLTQEGSIVQREYYYPFGMTMPELENDNKHPYRYNGKELDQMHRLDLYDYSARYYDQAIGRFTTVDPHAESYYNISPYVYAANNPINVIDPNGMDTVYVNQFNEEFLRIPAEGDHVTFTASPDIYVVPTESGQENVDAYSPPLFPTPPNLNRHQGGGLNEVYPEMIVLVPARAGFKLTTEAVIGTLGAIKQMMSGPGTLNTIDAGKNGFAKMSRKSGKEKANDLPDWVRYCEPQRPTESLHQFATRVLNEKHGYGKWKTGPNTEYNKIIKGYNKNRTGK